MKYIICLIILSLAFVACKKDLGSCKDYKEVTGRDQAIDINTIDFKPFRDTLAKYPELQPNRYTSDQYSKNLVCNKYYYGLLVFSDIYALYKNNNADSIQKNGTLLAKPDHVILVPSVSHTKAIENAKKYINFDYSCISYRLGFYHLNPGVPGRDEYRLAWKIMSSDKANRYVISDASNNMIFEVNGGVYFTD